VKSRLGRRPSPALIVAIVALVVALGGTAIAANTIRSGDIVNGQVKTADLADGAVNSVKVQRGALEGKDLHMRSVGTAEQAPVPAIDAYMSTDDLVPANNQVALGGFDGATFDTAHMLRAGSIFLTTPISGIYRATLHVDWVGQGSTTLPAGTQCTIQLWKGHPRADTSQIAATKGDCSAGKAIELNRSIAMTATQGLHRGTTLYVLISQNSGSDFTLDGASHPLYLDLTWVGPSS